MMLTTNVTEQIFSFDSLIFPIAPELFFNDYWEQRPLYLRRGDSNHYSRLLSTEDLERIIAFTDVRHPSLRVAKSGAYLPPAAYADDIHYGDDYFVGVPNIEKVSAEYRSGSTVILPALHRTWAPLGSLCADLEAMFDHVVHANAYLTPGNAAGFAPHYDAHDVFILQIGGVKHWRVQEPQLSLPHHTQPCAAARLKSAEPLLEVDMHPGDLMYIPRGYIHAAATSDVYSAHVTLGVTVYTWVELMQDLISSCRGDLEFRRALPPGFASREELRGELAATLRRLAERFVREADFETIVTSFDQRVLLTHAAKRECFNAHVVAVGLDTVLKVLPRDEYEAAYDINKIELTFNGKTRNLPGYVRESLDAMCKKQLFAVHDVAAPLGDEATLVLIRFLRDEGFLRDPETANDPSIAAGQAVVPTLLHSRKR
jgi:ribosomal protein L16 Arg81 hydroxylase